MQMSRWTIHPRRWIVATAIICVMVGCSQAGTRPPAPGPSAPPPGTVVQAPPPVPVPVPQTDAPLFEAWGVATGERTYSLWWKDQRGLKQITTIDVPTIHSAFIKASLSPDHRLVAYVPDFDGRFGNRLVVSGLDGKTQVSVDRYVTSFSWMPTGDAIAVTFLQEVDTPEPPVKEVILLRLDGSITKVTSGQQFDRVLGASADGTRLYVTYTPDRNFQYSPESFGWIDVATGRLAPVFESRLDGQNGPAYTDFALTPLPGSDPLVSFLEGRGKFDSGIVVIAHADGTAKRTIQLPMGYGTFRFSPGAQRLAFARDDGIWTADGDGHGAKRLAVEGSLSTWILHSITPDGDVWVSHPLAGFVKLVPDKENRLPLLPKW